MTGKKFDITNKILFLIGLIFFLLGQLILAKGNDFVYNQEPIDFAHWFLLIGVTLLIPQTVTFPKKIYSLIGIPLTLIGIVCIIGMCVLDFRTYKRIESDQSIRIKQFCKFNYSPWLSINCLIFNKSALVYAFPL